MQSALEQPASARRLSPLTFLLVAVFVDLLGYGIVIPLLPLYVARQADGALVGVLAALYALAQAIGGPALSGLSDRYGRRPILLLCLSGTALAYLLLGLADTLALLAIAILLDGLTGGNLSTVQAYIADSTTPEQRARGFGLLGAAFALGMMAGPLLGGLLSGYGLSAPAFAAAVLAFANVLFGLAVLPESLPPARRTQHARPALNPLRQIATVLALRHLRGLLLVIFLVNLSFAGLQTNFPLFSSQRFAWDVATNAFFFAFVGACAVLTQVGLLGWLRPRLGERRLVLGGLALMAVGLPLIALVPQAGLLYPVVALVALGSNLAIPALSSLVSHRTADTAQGQMMGALQTTLNGALVAGPLLAGLTFEYLAHGAPYALGGAVALSALVLAWHTGDKMTG